MALDNNTSQKPISQISDLNLSQVENNPMPKNGSFAYIWHKQGLMLNTCMNLRSMDVVMDSRSSLI